MRQKASKRIIVIAAALIVAMIAGILVYNSLPVTKMHKQLDLGNKYLAALDYEQAVAAFTKAIEIMPDSPEAKELLVTTYLAWADDLVAKGETDRALSVLEEGYALIPDERLKSKIDELKEQPEEEVEIDENEQMEVLFQKLGNVKALILDMKGHKWFSFYGVYKTFDEMEAAYAPLMEALEDYIAFLEEHPSLDREEPDLFFFTWERGLEPDLNEYVYWAEGDMYGQDHSRGMFGKAAAHHMLSLIYRRIGRMDECMRERTALAEYLNNDYIHERQVVDEDGNEYKYDQYGRLTYLNYNITDSRATIIYYDEPGDGCSAYSSYIEDGIEVQSEYRHQNGQLTYEKNYSIKYYPSVDSERDYMYEGDTVRMKYTSYDLDRDGSAWIDSSTWFKIDKYGYPVSDWIVDEQ